VVVGGCVVGVVVVVVGGCVVITPHSQNTCIWKSGHCLPGFWFLSRHSSP
jgi:hypothetical protein